MYLWLCVWQECISQDIWTPLSFRLIYLQMFQTVASWLHRSIAYRWHVTCHTYFMQRTFISMDRQWPEVYWIQELHQIHMLSMVLGHVMDLQLENTDGTTGLKWLLYQDPHASLQMEDGDLPAIDQVHPWAYQLTWTDILYLIIHIS